MHQTKLTEEQLQTAIGSIIEFLLDKKRTDAAELIKKLPKDTTPEDLIMILK